jgi:hypothetical protein
MNLLLLLLAVSGAAQAAPTTAPTPDACGDPRLVSQAYRSFEATPIRVLGPTTLLVAPIPNNLWNTEQLARCSSGCKVHLVDLMPPDPGSVFDSGRAELEHLVSSAKHISILLSPVQNKSDALNALVAVEGLNLTRSSSDRVSLAA